MENNNDKININETSQNKDFWDRKIDGLAKIFELMVKQPWALLLIVSVICNIWLGKELITTNQELYGKITEEVRKQAPAIMSQEVDKKMAEPKAKIDSVTNQIRDIIKEIKPNEE